jgi:hypothetical protein
VTDNITPFPISFMLAIAEAREAGAKAERERIIALLEAAPASSDYYNDPFGYAIALIKGDN